MAMAYAKLIMAGLKTMDDVPFRLRDDVQKILDEARWTPPENND